MANVLMTMAEDPGASSAGHFAVRYAVDEHDCLHFAESLKATGHHLYFVNWMDLSGREFARMFSYNRAAFVAPVAVGKFDLVFVYKMEGFLNDLPRFYRMLGCFSASRTVNDLATIRHNVDKTYLRELGGRGVRIIPSYDIVEAAERLRKGQPLVLKPLKGERGKHVFLARQPSDLDSIGSVKDQFFAQDFIPAVGEGERSLVFLGHEFQHAVIKHPRRGEFRCNESLGGTVAVHEPSAEELDFAARVLHTYEALGYPVHFSRIDLLTSEKGPLLLEAELLNPSIYANYCGRGKQFGERIAAYFDCFLRSARQAVQ